MIKRKSPPEAGWSCRFDSNLRVTEGKGAPQLNPGRRAGAGVGGVGFGLCSVRGAFERGLFAGVAAFGVILLVIKSVVFAHFLVPPLRHI